MTEYNFPIAPLSKDFLSELLAADPVISEWEAWSAALRSGKYEQCHGTLHKVNYGFCCLGVKCDLVDPNGWQEPEHHDTSAFAFDDAVWRDSTLPPTIAASMFNNIGAEAAQNLLSHFATPNDAGVSFAEIADFIDEVVRQRKAQQ